MYKHTFLNVTLRNPQINFFLIAQFFIIFVKSNIQTTEENHMGLVQKVCLKF